MSIRAENGGISIHAIPGTRSVLFGLDATEEARIGLLGFALGKRAGDGRIRWQRGFKFFAETVPDPQPGERRSTLEHPIQSFLWGDYSAGPDQTFTYVFRPLYGTPENLVPGPDVEVTVRTHGESGSRHAVFFNRGAIPSQAFADRFGNAGPNDDEKNDPDNDKVKWLSRGLLEAALSFISEANGPRFELRVAAYEFYYQPILNALRIAAGTGAKVQVCYDGGDRKRDGSISATSISTENAAAIGAAGLDGAANVTLYPRTRYSGISHNKFILLLEDGQPRAVWTGSTNFTPSGFLGQSNVGHLVRVPEVAGRYNTYWEEFARDPATRGFKTFNTAEFPTPPDAPPPEGTTTIFSPRRKGMMEWYANRLAAAGSSVMFTAAFGVATELAEKFGEDRDFLRFLLMEKPDRNPDEQRLIERDRDTRIALGQHFNRDAIKLETGGFRLDQWFREEEHFRKKGHIFYVHTKYMLIDALGQDPQVLSGSANFSTGSVESNDENMLLIRGGEARVSADIYLNEFMRMFNHFYFRTVAIRRARQQRGRSGGDTRPVSNLDPTDGWTRTYFTPGTYHERRRTMFR
ncbi:phospholipase D-like domain-containing protein [Roseibium marinum]|uniref:Phospholipase D n=1 Tax=Roseibium marinum TaxID=281252 RepID=A0A2S3V2N2_9HYPH|nr:phospholipase D-like domain-containing protein [Roseibium marinum]POF34043.1 phosphatidylserine/phosphatidylglycerophosphate/cardiolipin synthase-like enzyme [Roseibium marinum]